MLEERDILVDDVRVRATGRSAEQPKVEPVALPPGAHGTRAYGFLVIAYCRNHVKPEYLCVTCAAIAPSHWDVVSTVPEYVQSVCADCPLDADQ